MKGYVLKLNYQMRNYINSNVGSVPFDNYGMSVSFHLNSPLYIFNYLDENKISLNTTLEPLRNSLSFYSIPNEPTYTCNFNLAPVEGKVEDLNYLLIIVIDLSMFPNSFNTENMIMDFQYLLMTFTKDFNNEMGDKHRLFYTIIKDYTSSSSSTV